MTPLHVTRKGISASAWQAQGRLCYNCCMRVLFIGGTGIISTACTQLAAQCGIHLTLATRGRRAALLPAGVQTLTLDMDDGAGAAQALAGESRSEEHTSELQSLRH